MDSFLAARATTEQVKAEAATETHEQYELKDENKTLDSELSGMPSTSLKLKPMEEYTPEQRKRIFEYLQSVDQNLITFYNESQKENSGKTYVVGEASQRMADEIKKRIGIDVSGSQIDIRDSLATHIHRRHGENGIHDHTMSDVNDIGRINYVLQHFDNITEGTDTSAYKNYEKEKNKQRNAKTVIISMAIDGTHHIIEAVTTGRKNKLHVISSYFEYEKKTDKTIKKSDADVFLNAESNDSPPVVTSENVKHSASDNTSVQQSDTENNSENGQNRNDVRYSLMDIEEHDSETERLIRENNDLGEALQAANTLIDIMRKRPDGLPAAPSAASIDRLARKIKDETGTKVSLKNLRENLDKTFTVMLNAERSRVRRFRKLIFWCFFIFLLVCCEKWNII